MSNANKVKLGAQSRAGMAQKAEAAGRAKAVRGENAPTPERATRDDWEDVDLRTMPEGSMLARSGDKPRKQASRVERMLAEKWIDKRGAMALELYEQKLEASGYGNTKSCLNISGGGGSGGASSPTPAATQARGWLAVHEFAVKFHVAPEPLEFVRSVLAPYGGETIGDVAERMLPGGRRRRMEIAADNCREVAAAFVAVLAK